MTRGTRSVFEGIKLPPFKHLNKHWQSEKCVTALTTIFNLLIQLPQLAVLVREYDPNKHDDSYVAKVMHQIQSLHESGCDVADVVEALAVTTRTRYASVADILPWSYTFRSTYRFDLANHHFTFRILLGGIAEFFSSHAAGPASSYMDLPAILAETERSTRGLTMCAEYSLNHYRDAACVASRLTTPLTHAFASWHRIERRKAAGGTPALVRESLEAGRLKTFCFRLFGEGLSEWWGLGELPEQGYVLTCCEAAQGGPAVTADECWASLEQGPLCYGEGMAWRMTKPVREV